MRWPTASAHIIRKAKHEALAHKDVHTCLSHLWLLFKNLIKSSNLFLSPDNEQFLYRPLVFRIIPRGLGTSHPCSFYEESLVALLMWKELYVNVFSNKKTILNSKKQVERSSTGFLFGLYWTVSLSPVNGLKLRSSPFIPGSTVHISLRKKKSVHLNIQTFIF